MTGLPLFTASGTFPEAQDARARAVDPGWSAQLVAASIQELSANIHAQYQPKSTGKGVLEQKAAIGGSWIRRRPLLSVTLLIFSMGLI